MALSFHLYLSYFTLACSTSLRVSQLLLWPNRRRLHRLAHPRRRRTPELPFLNPLCNRIPHPSHLHPLPGPHLTNRKIPRPPPGPETLAHPPRPRLHRPHSAKIHGIKPKAVHRCQIPYRERCGLWYPSRVYSLDVHLGGFGEGGDVPVEEFGGVAGVGWEVEVNGDDAGGAHVGRDYKGSGSCEGV